MTNDEIEALELADAADALAHLRAEAAERDEAEQRKCELENDYRGATTINVEVRLRLDAAERQVAMLREALADSLEQNVNCWLNHYGENPEGGSEPPHIARAKTVLAKTEKKDG